jgi:hypothetical protein
LLRKKKRQKGGEMVEETRKIVGDKRKMIGERNGKWL